MIGDSISANQVKHRRTCSRAATTCSRRLRPAATFPSTERTRMRSSSLPVAPATTGASDSSH